jgi:hypothetical protein
VLKDLARWVRRSTKARANSKQSSPAEKIILLGGATVCTGLRKSEPMRFLKEMNILSAHRSFSLRRIGLIPAPSPAPLVKEGAFLQALPQHEGEKADEDMRLNAVPRLDGSRRVGQSRPGV